MKLDEDDQCYHSQTILNRQTNPTTPCDILQPANHDVGIQTLFLADVIEPSSIVNNINDNIYVDERSDVSINNPVTATDQ